MFTTALSTRPDIKVDHPTSLDFGQYVDYFNVLSQRRDVMAVATNVEPMSVAASDEVRTAPTLKPAPSFNV
jgi:hypothetical protein